MKNYVSGSVEVDTFTAETAVKSGVPVIVGASFMIPAFDAAVGEPCEGALTGVFSLPKKPDDVATQRQPAYWDASAGHVTVTSGEGKVKVGVFCYAEAGGSEYADVRLDGVSVDSVAAGGGG